MIETIIINRLYNKFNLNNLHPLLVFETVFQTTLQPNHKMLWTTCYKKSCLIKFHECSLKIGWSHISFAPPSLMGHIARKANVMKRCPKVNQNMRINMVLTIFDNIVRFKRNLKELFGSKAEIWLSPQNIHCKISIFSNGKKSRA